MDRCRTVAIELPESLLSALGRAAAAAGVPPADWLRAALLGALDRSPARLRPHEEEIARALHLSTDWLGLQRRLRALGHVLRLDGTGDLVLRSWPVERTLMPAARIGLGRAALTLRFGTDFPADVPRPPRADLARDQRADRAA